MPDIDDRWLDVDFTRDERFLPGYTSAPTFSGCRDADDVMPVIPEAQWRQLAEDDEADGGGLDRLPTRMYNQASEGSCVGNATTQQHEVMQAAAFGKSRVIPISPMSVYRSIGTSPNSGAMVDDALEHMVKVGALPLDTPANRATFGQHVMSHTNYRQNYPRDWEKTATKFRVDEYFTIRSVAAMFSSLFRGFPVVVGRAGHSILYLRPMYVSGRWVVKYINSWSEDWGEGFGQFKGGFGYDSLRLIQESSSWAFACRSIISPQNSMEIKA